MYRLIATLAAITLAAGTVALADDNALGFYFSNSEFTLETAGITIIPGYARMGYIVLTSATGSVVSGYEVSIAATAPDFSILMTGLGWGQNSGTNANQIVHFLTPVPVAAAGTVLTFVIFGTDSTDAEEISFGPASPSSLPGGTPVVDFDGGNLQACSYPFGTPVVAWLNGEPVANESTSWSSVKALFN
jgi:hypothetical protein